MNNTYVRRICIFAFAVNFLLFCVKLYIGLSTNSIGIFSDSINNLFDSLSGILTFVCVSVVMRSKDLSAESTTKNAEQLCSFLMAIAITFTGFYFAYTSLERFMYPTPVWYTNLYAGVLGGTAAVKLAMFIYLRSLMRKEKSPVARVMMTDSLLDFFITCVTILTLIVSANGSFAFDAMAGLAISIVIIISAVRTVIRSGAKLINYVPAEKKDAFYNSLNDNIHENIKAVSFVSAEDEITAYITVDFPDIQKEITEKIRKDTGITPVFIKKG